MNVVHLRSLVFALAMSFFSSASAQFFDRIVPIAPDRVPAIDAPAHAPQPQSADDPPREPTDEWDELA